MGDIVQFSVVIYESNPTILYVFNLSKVTLELKISCFLQKCMTSVYGGLLEPVNLLDVC